MKPLLRLLFPVLLFVMACNTLAAPLRSAPPELPRVPTAGPSAAAVPSATPASQDTDAPETARQAGGSRRNPVPYGETAASLDLDFRVMEVVSGEAAWQMLQAANRFNEAAPRGAQWMLVRIEVLNQSNRTLTLNSGAFLVTGSLGVAYFSSSAVAPSPKFDFVLKPGERADGWLDFLVSQADDNFLVFHNPVDAPLVFAALSPGARVEGVSASPPPLSGLGRSREMPAPPGEAVAGGGWRIWVQDALRGEAAWRALQQADAYNDPPLPGYEYLAVYLGVAAEHEGEEYRMFFLTTLACQTSEYAFEAASAVPPYPSLEQARLFPGAVFRGWTVFLVPEGEPCMLVYDPILSLEDNRERYLALP